MKTLVKKRFINTGEYHKMGETGMFHPEENVELINGEIYTMAPIGSKHAATVEKISDIFRATFDKRYKVRTQNPIRLDQWNEPEPDVALVRIRHDYYATGHPKPEDVVHLVEVSETSYGYDKDIKVPLYASAGIPVYWIVNLDDHFIEVFEQPKENFYQKRTRYNPGDTIFFQSQSLEVSRMLLIS